MELIFAWTKLIDSVARDSITHFGRSSLNAFSVRERDPPGS